MAEGKTEGGPSYPGPLSFCDMSSTTQSREGKLNDRGASLSFVAKNSSASTDPDTAVRVSRILREPVKHTSVSGISSSVQSFSNVKLGADSPRKLSVPSREQAGVDGTRKTVALNSDQSQKDSIKHIGAVVTPSPLDMLSPSWTYLDHSCLDKKEFRTNLADSMLFQSLHPRGPSHPYFGAPKESDGLPDRTPPAAKFDAPLDFGSVYHQASEGPKSFSTNSPCSQPLYVGEHQRSHAPIYTEDPDRQIRLPNYCFTSKLPVLTSTSLFRELQHDHPNDCEKKKQYQAGCLSLDLATTTTTATAATTLGDSSPVSIVDDHAEDLVVPAIRHRLAKNDHSLSQTSKDFDELLQQHLQDVPSQNVSEIAASCDGNPPKVPVKRSFLKKGARNPITQLPKEIPKKYRYYAKAVAQKLQTDDTADTPNEPLPSMLPSKGIADSLPGSITKAATSCLNIARKQPLPRNPLSSSTQDRSSWRSDHPNASEVGLSKESHSVQKRQSRPLQPQNLSRVTKELSTQSKRRAFQEPERTSSNTEQSLKPLPAPRHTVPPRTVSSDSLIPKAALPVPSSTVSGTLVAKRPNPHKISTPLSEVLRGLPTPASHNQASIPLLSKDVELLTVQAQAKIASVDEQIARLTDYQKTLEQREALLTQEREQLYQEVEQKRLQLAADRESQLLEIETARRALRKGQKQLDVHTETVEALQAENDALEDQNRKLKVFISQKEDQFREREERYQRLVERLGNQVHSLERKNKALTEALNARISPSVNHLQKTRQKDTACPTGCSPRLLERNTSLGVKERQGRKTSSARKLSCRSRAQGRSSTSNDDPVKRLAQSTPVVQYRKDIDDPVSTQRILSLSSSAPVNAVSRMASPSQRWAPELANKETHPETVVSEKNPLPYEIFKTLLEFDVHTAWAPFDEALLPLRKLDATSLKQPPIRKPDGRQEFLYHDGHREIVFGNGMRRVMCPVSGWVFNFFANGDIRGVSPSGFLYYYFHQDTIYSITHPDGTIFNSFANGQVDCRHADGTVQVRFPQGMLKQIDPDGAEHIQRFY